MEKSESRVNVHNEKQMIELGYRHPLAPRDESVWTKTDVEKTILKKTKRMFKNYKFVSSWPAHPAPIPVYDKIIIQLSKEANVPNGHLTYTKVCGQSDISKVLNSYLVSDEKSGKTHSLVLKYKWNGTWYSPTELPVYFW